MRILVLGAGGMAGHVLAAYLSRQAGFEVEATIRPGSRELRSAAAGQIAQGTETSLPARLGVRVHELDGADLEAVSRLVGEVHPDAIVNAIGILNRDAEERPLHAYTVNGLLPHWLAHAAGESGARLIHVSSDCVFSGERGSYGEEELPDGTTVYARSKALGEVREKRHLTLRTSIIGPEIREGGIGLMKWFLTQQGNVPGYVNVPWNGVTTLELAKAAEWAIRHPHVGGLVHLTAPEPISKHRLLEKIARAYGKEDAVVVPVAEPVLDRTLLPTKSGFGYPVSGYDVMLGELVEWERASMEWQRTLWQ
ncbi:dTDP-4-dehydrorhamnose reductase family protein [Cohnella fermenti]|uniref:dTDP-4-dehydrorhamnose reductase n=1 Tax=Cohnella fermenti TaxID=2565925 RepID=A0A4S4BG44_9BACL|nr:SDR family oxidoreductase [Cohnella fermenti]THF73367.1 SDR family oxidoreductase [Cohnella fermenti]